MAVFLAFASGCVVWQSDFDEYVKATDEKIAQARITDEILLCESRVDAYQDLVASDEPDPTRRDEPSGTRRDLAACMDELNTITNSHVEDCNEQMAVCPTSHSAQDCRNCLKICLSSGTWPTTGVVACPL